ncbi:unnamed protein product [Sphagnum jensenii]
MERPSEFRLLLQSKEQELINLCDQQIQSLHTRVIISLFLTSSYASHIASATVPGGNKKISTGQIREKEKVEANLAAQISQLQDDFKYNLSLLDSRDAELAQYDTATATLQASVVETEERLKVSRKALAEAHTLRIQEKARVEELKELSQQKLEEVEKEVLPPSFFLLYFSCL